MDQKPVFTKRKLALWYTRTFKPIMTHKELEPILINLGFVGLPPSAPGFGGGHAWKEYVYSAGVLHLDHITDASPPPSRPRVRLPYPRIDGLHIRCYETFLDAINFYVKMHDISLLFHVRGMAIRHADGFANWLYIDEERYVYLYREGTLDQVTQTLNSNKDDGRNNEAADDSDRCIIGSRSRRSQLFRMVPYTDIIVQAKGN